MFWVTEQKHAGNDLQHSIEAELPSDIGSEEAYHVVQ
jgi:hypothetical protein